MNAECHIDTHYKQCSCPPGFTGNADVECVRIPIACTSDIDCTDGYSCRDSMCLPSCHNDQDCALNEKCLRGNCMRKFPLYWMVLSYFNICIFSQLPAALITIASWVMCVCTTNASLDVTLTMIAVLLKPVAMTSASILATAIILVVLMLPALYLIIALPAIVSKVWFQILHHKSVAYAHLLLIAAKIATVPMDLPALKQPVVHSVLMMVVVYLMNVARMVFVNRSVVAMMTVEPAKFAWGLVVWLAVGQINIVQVN